LNNSVKIDTGSKLFLGALAVAQIAFPNGVLMFTATCVFYLLASQILQTHKPSVFFIILLYHFIQIAAGIWQANYLEKDINYRSPSQQTAIICCLVGLIFMFLPIIYYQNKLPKISRALIKKHADRLSLQKTFKVYVVSFFVINALVGIAFFVQGLTQVIFSLANIKWFLFLLFGFQAILKQRMLREFYIFASIEFALGFFSYFSEFKTIIFYTTSIFLVLISQIQFKQFVAAVFGIVFLVFAGVFWTGIKGDYRNFLNKGSKSQSVQVEKEEAFDKLIELSEKKGLSNFEESTRSFLDRLQYTYHIAKAMDRVPSIVPHQNGNNWLSMLTFVTTPRIINPNKGVYDASLKATKYTGIQYMGVKRGVSVSLGYFADGYIDFGYVFMFIPLLILGFIYGRSSYFFMQRSSNNFLFNISIVCAIFMELFAFESDGIFLFGRVYANLIVFFVLRRFAFKPLLAYLQMPVTMQKVAEVSSEEKEKIKL
jgi:hypothetical protein